MKLKERIILSDCDGVLVDWINGFHHFMSLKGHELIPGTETKYDLSKRYDVTFDEAMKLINEFNVSEHISRLKPIEGATEYVKKLAERGFRYNVVTSLSSQPEAYYRRKENLINTFGDVFDEIYCLETGASKYETLLNWQDSRLFWIEDHFKQADAGREVGLRPILFNDVTNEKFEANLFPRVFSWEQIYHIVCEDYGLEP